MSLATTSTILRPAHQRGTTQLDWLTSYHTFSFGEYFEPAFHQFGVLRVINDDWVAPQGGFGMHPHRDMEIVTIVLSGSLAHKDSLGNGTTIEAGEVQRMSAGTGIMHSEFNPSSQEPVHLLQIWLFPREKNLTPSYEQKRFLTATGEGFQPVVSPDGRDGSLTIHQDASISMAKLAAGEVATFSLQPEKQYWLHLATGEANVDGQALSAGDAVGIKGFSPEDSPLRLTAQAESQAILFELPAESP